MRVPHLFPPENHALTDAATHIRHLFLEPKESYSARDAAEILCMPLQDRKKSEGTNRPSGFWF